MKSEDIIKKLEDKLSNFEASGKVQNVGVVESIGDNVVVASGLSTAQMGEQVIFQDGATGLILNLDEDYVSIVLLGRSDTLKEGDSVRTTGKQLSVRALEELLGR